MIWLVIGIVLAVAVTAALMVKKDDPFQAAATELGLKLTRTVPELLPKLDGMVDGLAVKVDTVAQRASTIRYRVFYPALGLSLRLERETTITRTLGQLGSGDQEIGARAFDDSFRVNTSRPDALQKMMSPQLRRQLVSLIERYPNVTISDGDITLLNEGVAPQADTMIAVVRSLVDAATALVAVRPPALERTQTRHPTPKEPTTAAEPAPPKDQQPKPLPVTNESLLEPPEPAVETPTPPPPPEPVRPQPTGLPDNFFDDVFGANRLSYESDDRFDREIRGSQVTLAGTVKQATPYEADSDVSPPSGTKAIVTVAQIETDLYGETAIDAVVYLERAPSLARGDHIEFRGEIDAVDAFMRDLIVTNAAIRA